MVGGRPGASASSVHLARYRRRVVPPRPVPARLVAIAAALASCAVLPAAGQAATLGTDQRCYVTGEQAWLSGSGFAPRAPITVTRGTDVVPTPAATADNSGAFRRTLLVPEVPGGLVEGQIEVSATDGAATARTFLNIARVTASFSPTEGDLRTLRVSHVVSGFGLAEERPSVYLHYVSPAAQKATQKSVSTGGTTALNAQQKTGGSTVAAADPPGVRTYRLGLLRGPCGVLRTSPRKLFRSRPPRARGCSSTTRAPAIHARHGRLELPLGRPQGDDQLARRAALGLRAAQPAYFTNSADRAPSRKVVLTRSSTIFAVLARFTPRRPSGRVIRRRCVPGLTATNPPVKRRVIAVPVSVRGASGVPRSTP